MKASLAPLAGKTVQGLKVLYLSADVGPWMDTDMALKPGDKVTMILDGKMWLSRTYNLSFESKFAVWARVGARGPIFRGTTTNTFVVKEAGTLQLKTYPGQRWLDTSGRYEGDPAPSIPTAAWSERGGGAVEPRCR